MTNEERDIISQFIARVGGATPPASFASGSVPATILLPSSTVIGRSIEHGRPSNRAASSIEAPGVTLER